MRELRVNGQIEAPVVRLIDGRNNQLGVLDLHAALARAREQGLDLVEVGPHARPPVCRLMTYGRDQFNRG